MIGEKEKNCENAHFTPKKCSSLELQIKHKNHMSVYAKSTHFLRCSSSKPASVSPACNPLLLGNEFLEFFMRRACYVMTSCSFHEMSGDVCELLWNYDRYRYASTSVNTTSTLFMQIKREKKTHSHTHTLFLLHHSLCLSHAHHDTVSLFWLAHHVCIESS